MAAKKYNRNGFEYYCERFFYDYTWYFKPKGCAYGVECPSIDFGKVKKNNVEEFLNDAEKAHLYYKETLHRLGDVAAAEKNVEFALAAVERTKSPDYDPGGSTNNPGRVARAMREPREQLEAANSRLETALRVSRIMADGNVGTISGGGDKILQ